MSATGLSLPDRLRYLLGLFETKNLAIAARVLATNTEVLLQTIDLLENHFQTILFDIKGDSLSPTYTGEAIHRYLIDTIREVKEPASPPAPAPKSAHSRPQLTIAAHGANPFTRSVLPEFAEYLSRNSPYDFRVEGVASQAEILERLRLGKANFGLMPPPRTRSATRRSIGSEPFNSERAVVCAYFMRFAMITFRNTGIISLSDLLGQRVATGFGVNSLADDYLNAYLKDAVGGRENIVAIECSNIADAMDRLRERQIVATLYPLEGIKIASLARGVIRLLEGAFSEETKKALIRNHPGLKVRCGTLFGSRHATVVETPLVFYAGKSEDDKLVDQLIRTATEFFGKYIKHRYGEVPNASFFNPAPNGLKTHRASLAYFARIAEKPAPAAQRKSSPLASSTAWPPILTA